MPKSMHDIPQVVAFATHSPIQSLVALSFSYICIFSSVPGRTSLSTLPSTHHHVSHRRRHLYPRPRPCSKRNSHVGAARRIHAAERPRCSGVEREVRDAEREHAVSGRRERVHPGRVRAMRERAVRELPVLWRPHVRCAPARQLAGNEVCTGRAHGGYEQGLNRISLQHYLRYRGRCGDENCCHWCEWRYCWQVA